MDPDEVDWARPVDGHAVANGFDHFRGNACAINFAPYVYMIVNQMQFLIRHSMVAKAPIVRH